MSDTAKVLAMLRDRLEAARAADPTARSVVVTLAAGDVPFDLPVGEIVRNAPVCPKVVEGDEAARAPMMPGEEPTDDPPSEAEFPTVRLRGVASSTSQDWYGTEMSRPCLDDMAAQFRSGVDLLPRHHGFLATVEWDEVLGRTDAATLLSGPVAEPSTNEPGFRLEIQASCPGTGASGQKVRELVERLDAGQPIGLSIGGWFRSVQYVWADGADPEWDAPERIIINKVDLEHLAVVRSPANPDAVGLQVLRSAGVVTRSRPAAVPEPEATPPGDENRATSPAPEYDNPEPTSPATPDERSVMDTQEILAAITGLNATISNLSSRIDAIDQRSATTAAPATPATPAVTEERAAIARLEAEIARMKAADAAKDNILADLAAGARAINVDDRILIDDEHGRKEALRARIARAREIGQGGTVATLAERNIDVLATNPLDVPGAGSTTSEAGDRARRARAALPNLLRAVCNAADRDGVFNYTSSELRGWK